MVAASSAISSALIKFMQKMVLEPRYIKPSSLNQFQLYKNSER